MSLYRENVRSLYGGELCVALLQQRWVTLQREFGVALLPELWVPLQRELLGTLLRERWVALLLDLGYNVSEEKS